MIEENPKERFEKIKNLFNSSSFISDVDSIVKVSSHFIQDFDFLIKLVENLDKRNHIERVVKE